MAMVEWLVLPIQEVPISSLGTAAKFLSGFPQSLQTDAGKVEGIQPRQRHSTSFPAHRSQLMPPLNVN
jgi:hypothetical protein